MVDDPLINARILLFGRSASTYGGIITYLTGLAHEIANHNVKVVLALNRDAVSSHLLFSLRDKILLEEYPTPTNAYDYVKVIDAIIDGHSPSLFHFNDNNKLARKAIVRSEKLKMLQGRRILTIHADIAKYDINPSSLNLFQLLKRRLEVRRFLACFDQIISVSEFYGKQLSHSLLTRRLPIVSIPLGFDEKIYLPQSPVVHIDNLPNTNKYDPKQCVIGYSGFLVPGKRFDIALHSIALVAKKHKVRFKIAGDGPEKDKLQQLASQLGISDIVEFLGFVRDIPTYLKTLDIFLCTSQSEAGCYAQLEAMAAGLPSVCSSTGDISLRISHGINGFLVKPGDIEGFAQHLTKLIEDPQLRQKIGKNAHELVITRYTNSVCLNRILNIYRQMLSCRNLCARNEQ